MCSDRRNFRQQCSMNNQNIQEFHVRSSSWSTSDERNENYIKLIRGQARMITEENQVNTRPSSETIRVNDTDPLDIDEASLNLIVDQQVIFFSQQNIRLDNLSLIFRSTVISLYQFKSFNVLNVRMKSLQKIYLLLTFLI